jgi:hypothetical protein
MINKQTIKNKQLITKNLRVKAQTEKTLKYIEDAKAVRVPTEKPKTSRDLDVAAEF